MALARITAFDESGLELINRQLEQFDLLKKQIANLQSTSGQSQVRLASLENQKQTTGADNLIFTWDGTSRLSWAQGFVEDRNAKIFPVPAGSMLLLPTTTYWMGWNSSQGQMSAQQKLNVLTAIPQILVICSVKTGGAAGAAGGGGTDPGGVGPTGKAYSLL